MTLTEKLKLKTTIQLFGGTAVNLGYKLAKSGKLDMSPSMLLELEDAMVPLVLQYNELLVELKNLKVENAELKAKGGFDFGSSN